MFLYISLLSSVKQQREMIKFKVLWRTRAHDSEFFFLLPYLNAVPINLAPGYFVHLYCTVERSSRKSEITLSSDVFVAVAVVVAKFP